MAQEETLHLRLSCWNLPRQLETTGVRVSLKAQLPNGQGFVEIGETEVIKGEPNPTFTTVIPIIVRADLNQRLRFELHQMSTGGVCSPIGRVNDIGLRTIINATSEILLPVDPVGNRPMWELEESPLIGVESQCPDGATNGTLMRFQATNLHCEQVVQLSSYFTISLIHNSTKKFPTLLYKSEIIASHNPKWKEFVIPTKFISTASQSLLEFACYAFRYNNTDIPLGKSTFTFTQLLNGAVSKFMLHAVGQHRREHTFIELIKFDRVSNVPNYIAEIKAGMKLHFTVAIDFTAKNGGPNDPNSLHFVHPNVHSSYMQALRDVAEAVCPYDSQNRVSLVGFGAKIPPHSEFSNSFPLNGNPANPYVRGVDNVLSAYRQASMSVLPFAPTDYSAVVHDVIKLAKIARKNGTKIYFVLIILTNGFLKQATDTVDTIVQAADLPISILFTGVSNPKHPIGEGDHTRLTRLIDPSLKSTATNQPLRRQCVSFVEYEPSNDKHSTRELLSVIPMQVTQYLMMNPR